MKISYYLAGAGLVGILFFPGTIIAQQIQERATIIPASPDAAGQQTGVFSFLKEYFSALAQGEVEQLATYHPSLTPEQLETLRNYFAHTIRDLHIHLQDVRAQVVANTATVSFYRTDQFIDQPTGRSVEKSIQLSTQLVHSAGSWRLAGLDQVAFALGSKKTRLG